MALLLTFISLHFFQSQTLLFKSLFLLPVFQEDYTDPYHLLSDPPFCFHNTLHFSHPSSKHINHIAAAAAAKLLQSCLTLCDPIDGSPQGSPVPGILQARTLEWVAISFSNAWKWKVKVKSLSRVGLLATPWTVAFQAPLSVGFSRQEYWSGHSVILLS